MSIFPCVPRAPFAPVPKQFCSGSATDRPRWTARPGDRIVRLLIFLTLVPLAPGAEEATPISWWSALTVDNDFFHGSDEQYTSGIRYSRIKTRQDPGEDPDWLHRWSRTLMPPGRGEVESGWYVAQYIFTPSDRKKWNLGPSDRPYAGWLGGGMWVRESSHARSTALGITVGWVGPGSLAERFQDGLHKIIGHTQYAWSDELRNEPTLNLHYRESRRVWEDRVSTVRARLDVEAGIDAGTLSIGLVGRAVVRVGSFAPVPYFPTERFGPGPQIGLIPDPRAFGWGFLVGAESRLVGRDLFLDGNMFKTSHSVETKALIGSFMAGASFKMRSWMLHYTFVYHGRVFRGQEAPHRYGSIVVARQF